MDALIEVFEGEDDSKTTCKCLGWKTPVSDLGEEGLDSRQLTAYL